MPEDHVDRAMTAGARRSREACSPPSPERLHIVLWRRFKWPVIGLGLFLLLDLIAGIAASTAGVKF